MQNERVAVVTGGNKGIGYGIVQGLCEKFNGRVYLTCRDEKRGNDSVNQLRQMGFNPLFHQLDINDEKSVQRFRDHIKTVEGGIDVLVNNAGIAFMSNSPDLKGIEAEATIVTNFFGTPLDI
ncbi:hypothetical protein PPYR_01779 [Photinus pyralis]|uniref:Carbonyl reductase [NADPH] 1 n=1 Tax=Photinus pyralis TaxID=7054 RepID=A0A5N4B5C7_PHOPY|nr:hypothetical protein PPYR_01779 [Photinus pyralis]